MTLYDRTIQRAVKQLATATERAAAAAPAMAQADVLAERLRGLALQVSAEADSNAQPFLQMLLPIEMLGHTDPEAVLAMASHSLGMPIEFEAERGTFVLRCGGAMPQGMPLVLTEI